MSNIAVQIGMVGFVAMALTACGRSEGKKEEVTPLPVAATSVSTSYGVKKKGDDSAAASRQLASQKSSVDAARCGIVFATAANLASRSGDSKGYARMSRGGQATQYVIDVAISDRGESSQQIKKTQVATTNGAEYWSQKQFETFISDCTKEFSDLAPIMTKAGLLK